MDLASRVSQTIAALRLRPGPAIVAVSGGADSVVLLELLSQCAAVHRLALIVAHVDHGIQAVHEPRAIVEQHAARLALPLRVIDLALGPDATETEARLARLEALEELAEREGAVTIFLAHHADDQAETVLMRFLRGSGPAGLAGMAPRRDRFVRPLLGFDRADLLAFATERQLAWWDDPANRDPRHLRSWLRRDILPAIASRIPDVAERLRDAAQHARMGRRAWREALRNWPGLAWSRDEVDSLDWDTLRALPPALRLALLQAFTREAGRALGRKPLGRVVRELSASGGGARADAGEGWRFELAFGRLRFLPPVPDRVNPPLPLEPAIGAVDWGRWHLAWGLAPAPVQQERVSSVAWFAPGPLTIRHWQPGDRLMPMGGVGHRLAVRCFQDARVPSSDRAGWPVLECGDTLAWIPGVCRSDHLLPVPGSTSLRVEVTALG